MECWEGGPEGFVEKPACFRTSFPRGELGKFLAKQSELNSGELKHIKCFMWCMAGLVNSDNDIIIKT